jgi:starch synthase
MNILFAVNEVAPVFKFGGLGDVGGSLPKALHQEGVDVRLVVPFHPEISIPDLVEVSTFNIQYAGKPRPVKVFLTRIPDTTIPLYLIHESDYLSNSTNAVDIDGDKYAVFAKAVTSWLSTLEHWQPQIVHCHDWHTGLIPLLLKHFPLPYSVKSIITIHNLGYQGITHSPVVKRLGIDPELCRILSWDMENHDLNFLMEGLLHADIITTVSQTYAKEILTPQYGHQLETILQAKRYQLIGIINGIDETVFNPAIDKLIYHTYTPLTLNEGKEINKQEFCREHSLDSNIPLVGYIGRIDVYQKGIDIILEYLHQKDTLPPHSFVFLGTGDRAYESKLHAAKATGTGINIHTLFDEVLAHRLYAAADYLIIPSRYEPCGLIQMIAMKYGTIPIAHKTGGLADTINAQNGYIYAPNQTAPFMSSLNQALVEFTQPSKLHSLRQKAIAADFTWQQSAMKYKSLYHQMTVAENLH